MTLRAQMTLHSDSNLPQDDCVNVFHFFEVPIIGVQANADNIYAALQDFYNASHGTAGVLAASLSPVLAETGTLRVYDLNDAEPRQPVDVYDVSLTNIPDSGTALPREVACCLSFNAAFDSGSPPARRRGRVFIGPLNATASDANGRTSQTVTDRLIGAAAALLADNETVWQVYSEVDGVGRDVIGGYVDTAFDTQRRRGEAPTSRVTFPG